ALYLAITGHSDRAERIAEDAYQRHLEEVNWKAAIGWTLMRSGNTDEACRFLDFDHDAGRMTTIMYPSYAVALNTVGRNDDAMAVLRKLPASTEVDKVLLVGFQICPDATLPAAKFTQMIKNGAGLADFARESITPSYWLRHSIGAL
ncbi:MAG: hypothetical protein WBM97_13320, partial [Sedimenticolaceae bacterium]